MDSLFHDLRQTDEWAEYLKLIGWKVERVPDYLYIKQIPLLPVSIGKLPRARNINWLTVKKVRKKYRIIKLIQEETIAKKTIWLDLRKSEKRLLLEMKSKTRYNIGLAKRKPVRVKVVDGKRLLHSPLLFERFFSLLRQNARRLRIFAMPRKWLEAQVKAFGRKCFVVVAYPSTSSGQAAELIAGNFFMTSKNVCFYSHNGSIELGRKLMAPTLCTWEGMLEAKRRRLKIFDFDGIYDGGRALKRWKGFSRFKKGFGGGEIEFSG